MNLTSKVFCETNLFWAPIPVVSDASCRWNFLNGTLLLPLQLVMLMLSLKLLEGRRDSIVTKASSELFRLQNGCAFHLMREKMDFSFISDKLKIICSVDNKLIIRTQIWVIDATLCSLLNFLWFLYMKSLIYPHILTIFEKMY